MSKICDCEYTGCEHQPSKCGNVATLLVEVFGHVTQLCGACAGITKVFAVDHYRELGPARVRRRDVPGVERAE